MASSVTKKNSLCRYFIRYGDCFHGENCQFIHAYPPQSSPQPQSQPAPVEPTPPTPAPYPKLAPTQQPLSAPQQQGYNMNKLICSFKSDLPNEIDFAMQVATLLANTDNFTWYKDYPLVDAICSSLHVFICVCDNVPTCYCYPRFWHKILTKNLSNQYLQAATVPPDMEQSYMNFDSLKDHDLKDHRKIYRRIKTAAELIKQFSMTTGVSKNEKGDENNFDYHQMKKKKLKASPSLLKFVSLLFHCDDTPLNLIGLDILSNTASKLSKLPDTTDDPLCTKLVQMFQEDCVDSIGCQDGDIYVVNRSIEVVSRLISSSSRRVTTNIINLITERNLVFRVEQFLTSHYDVTLFLSALECCYRISRHHPHLLTAVNSRYLMKILVNLLNCDDSQYFTPKALKKIKLIDEEDDSTVHQLTPLNNPPICNKPPVNSKPSVNNKPIVGHKPLVGSKTPVSNKASVNNKTPVNNKPPVSNKPPTTQPPLQARPPQSHKQNGPQTQNGAPTQIQAQNQKDGYTCLWDNCGTKFTEAKKVYTHVFEAHVGPLAVDSMSSCLWSGPNGSGPGCITKRPKYSLLTHLNDFHCNQVALERAVKPPEHPGYAPNAALLAIRRHANAHNDSNGLKNQSPLSVSVRLTAALILRNLATQCPEMRQALENHEPLLSEICMSNGRDESKIIAECLSLLTSE